MKVKPFLGPFSDSSLPVIYEDMVWKIWKVTDNDTVHVVPYSGIGARYYVPIEYVQQPYAEVDGKKYLVSYSPSDYPLPDEVEGDLEFIKYKFDMDEQQARELTMDEKEKYKVYRFIPKLPDQVKTKKKPAQPQPVSFTRERVVELLALYKVFRDNPDLKVITEVLPDQWKIHKSNAEEWLNNQNI